METNQQFNSEIFIGVCHVASTGPSARDSNMNKSPFLTLKLPESRRGD